MLAAGGVVLGDKENFLTLRRTLVPSWGYRLLWRESERRRRKLEATVKALLEVVEDDAEGKASS